MASTSALSTARAYHDAWSTGDFERAASLLDEDLAVEVPINEYPTKDSFADAVAGFGSMARRIDLLSEMATGDEAMLLYDMEVEGLGDLRVVEHFKIRGGRIVGIRQIHDTEPIRRDYSTALKIKASPDQVFDAVATLEGLRGWWTAIAAGSTEPGSEVHFGFQKMDEDIVMHVVQSESPRLVSWICLLHTGAPQWHGSRVRFQITETADGCELHFRHDDVPAELVAGGWQRFLGSLVKLVETGTGDPFAP
jgi:uncharacterized protein YndB with AHSA1/START domain